MSLTPSLTPQGFQTFITNLGIKDSTDDFVLIKSDVPCIADGVFTQSLFAGPSVTISRRNLKDNQAQGIVVISKNANVANGVIGTADAAEVIQIVATETGISPDNIVIASTGVIGRRYPIEKIRSGLLGIGKKLTVADFNLAARGIMTTDTVPKLAARQVGNAKLVGIAKGVGMIEPNMATMLAFFFTDAAIYADVLRSVFRSTVDKTFNCLSIDTDTSTSDTAIILANGLAGAVSESEFTIALQEIAHELVLKIARDGEGATKVIEVNVDSAFNYSQAKKVAKAIVNSPLLKTAVYGADPNWGRVAMAIGKCEDELTINPENVVIRFDDIQVYPNTLNEDNLEALRQVMSQDKVNIHVSLNIGEAIATVWGCDLSEGYVEINGKYST
ncbi:MULTISPECIES: bifunctional glutamate N-acetyltransferase/amino-acid acetyltransferase ArgJ [unclassified Tolypothrix]|uniref:bifunctional glutamate N-acetyltransferase/amino-acid acetyltransferase ArgJ n=1 Tax=unclassified Tolypothrix TaxID=2649714 RepID=UPI0005EAA58F|nr:MULTISPECIES: bifunctional glutamate N-acetyltransferase/amino-acid acetyltransferase ArgJ [unclassified Tolypothrix]BAY89932.1 ornithine acetyl transferase [Microchaete diplosiphon NIES-3275]EKE96954.1 glutamate N-acetyltransferase/amino-acid acetyltransferase [Tolypothrix sp. PCC 7601]MBE9082128.1 bifunctional glutamate N-acetyltransferase/amino-acid acetyltransferase ArgJ [Tolypothrix sp. LEGE 11397]UYD24167.1 bifunctional glutamate N-acetyltransferase/amino-acid acetyltransferase ArgJ [T